MSYSSLRENFISILVAVMLTACGSGGGDGDTVVTATRETLSLQITLETVSSASHGDIVPITLVVKNIGSETVTAMLGGAPEAISQIVQGDSEIWNWAEGKSFPPVLPSPHLILPNESKIYDLSWDQKDKAGNQVESGRYIIKAWFNTSEINDIIVSPLELAPELIEIFIE